MRTLPASQPLPSPERHEQVRSRELVRRVRAQAAAAGGALAFDHYMAAVLYEPALGYYAALSQKFGAAGDFVTAPELGSLFAACVSTQLARWFEAGVAPVVWEFGAGSGALSARLLEEFEAQGRSVELRIVEISSALQARQRERIAEVVPRALPRVQWLTQLPDTVEGVVLANELLDALPVRLFELGGEAGDAVRERVVMADPAGPGLVLASRPAEQAFCAAVQERLARAGWPTAQSPVAYRSELAQQAPAWVGSIGERLRGVMLVIDYGFPVAEYYHPQRAQGTLNCHYRHRSHADPLWWPGLSDITAHVDFSALYAAAREVGLDCLGYGSQASFLLGCDFARHFAAQSATDAQTQAQRAREANTLVSEAEMGELFKVIAFGRHGDIPGLSLAGRDRQGSLAGEVFPFNARLPIG